MLQWYAMLIGWIAGDVVWWRAAVGRLRGFRFAGGWRWGLHLFMAAQLGFMLFMLGGSIADYVPHWGPLIWSVVAYGWHLFLLPLAVVWMWGPAVVRRIRSCRTVAVASGPTKPVAPPTSGLTRRQALAAMSAILPPAISAGVGVVAVKRLGMYDVHDVTLRVPGLPADLVGLTIAHGSDLHIGRFLPDGVMERVADSINAMRADLVVFTGDLLDTSALRIQPGIDFMRRLDPRQGLVMIEGNHDVMHEAERFEKTMKDAGLPLLLDEATTFRIPGRATPVQMLGMTWGDLRRGYEIGGHYGREANRTYRYYTKETMAAALERTVAHREVGAFPILLAHHPHAFDGAVAAGLPLVLSGHTHGGQLMLTKHIGAGPIRFRYWTGTYEKGDSRLFVNNGVGNWFPLRVNAPAEVVKITLARG